MATVDQVNRYLQDKLGRQRLPEVSAVDAAQWLETAGILRDNRSRPGLPLRNFLRSGQVVGAVQRPDEKGGRWSIRGPHERARALLEQQDLMVVATSDEGPTPWVSPVFYAIDEDYNLFWVSAEDARHSDLIRVHRNVAIVVFDSDPVDAVYISAEAVELADRAEIATGADVMASKPQPPKWVISDLSDVTDGGPWRIYKATPRTIEVRREADGNGKTVVDRVEADFR
jgi:nitroimidazol reductase NimA-like FMN-containing flavoprotein (pyridoxamine 5'-phosphate oxidase superfamily)